MRTFKIIIMASPVGSLSLHKLICVSPWQLVSFSLYFWIKVYLYKDLTTKVLMYLYHAGQNLTNLTNVKK